MHTNTLFQTDKTWIGCFAITLNKYINRTRPYKLFSCNWSLILRSKQIKWVVQSLAFYARTVEHVEELTLRLRYEGCLNANE